MIRIFFISLACLWSLSGISANHYISNEGNDNASGTSPAAAWKSINRVNSAFGQLHPGDSILFRRGDLFYGALRLSASGGPGQPIVIAAYGTGAKPMLSGLSEVTGWINRGNGIFAAPVKNVPPDVNLVIRNGSVEAVGRYPNAGAPNGGYLPVDGGSGGKPGDTCWLSGPEMSTGTNWTGAELVIRIRRWNIQKQQIVAHQGGILRYIQSSAYTPAKGFGYFVQRDLRTLDTPGEWWYDQRSRKLYMFFGNDLPSKSHVEISTIDTLVAGSNKSNIRIINLQLAGADKELIAYQTCRNLVIRNCDFRYSGRNAVTGLFSSHIAVDSCTVTNSLGAGITLRNRMEGGQYQSVTNCQVDSTALLTGMEISGERLGRAGITVAGNNSLVAFNTVANSGYLGIEWWGSEITVRNNYVHHYTLVRDDGAGIYSFESIGDFPLPARTHRYITANIVTNGVGNNNGVPGSLGHTSTKGIYCDNNVYNVHIDSNIVAYNNGSGFYSNSGRNIELRDNIFFKNLVSHSFNRIGKGDSLMRGMSISNNIFYPYRFGYGNLLLNEPTLLTPEQDISLLGHSDSNLMNYNLSSDTALTMVTTWADGRHYSVKNETFAYLQQRTGWEAHATMLPAGGELLINPTRYPKTYSFNAVSKKSVDGRKPLKQLVLPPFTGIILYPPEQNAAR